MLLFAVGCLVLVFNMEEGFVKYYTVLPPPTTTTKKTTHKNKTQFYKCIHFLTIHRIWGAIEVLGMIRLVMLDFC